MSPLTARPLRPRRGPRDPHLLGRDGHAQHQPRAAALARLLSASSPSASSRPSPRRSRCSSATPRTASTRRPGSGSGAAGSSATSCRRSSWWPRCCTSPGPRVRSWIDRQFATPPRYEVTYTRAAIIAAITFGLIAMLIFVGIYMLQESLDLDPTVAHPERRAAPPAPAGDPVLPGRARGGAHRDHGDLLDRPRPDGRAPAQPLAAGEPDRLLQPAGLLRAVSARGGARPPPRPRRLAGLPRHRPLQAHQRSPRPRDRGSRAPAAGGAPAGDHPRDGPAVPLGRRGVRDPAAHTAGEDAPALAERIRAAVAERPFVEGEVFSRGARSP